MHIQYNDAYRTDVAAALSSVPEIEKLYGKKVLITGGTGMICSAVFELIQYLNDKKDADITVYLAGRSSRRTALRFPEEIFSYHFIPYDANRYTDLAAELRHAAAESVRNEICPEHSDRHIPDNPETENGKESGQMADSRSKQIAEIPGEKDGRTVDYVIHGAGNANPREYSAHPAETLLGNIIGLQAVLDLMRQNPGARLLYISSSEVYGRKDGNTPYCEDEYGYVDILNPRACYPNGKRASETLCASCGQEYGVDFAVVRPGHIYGPTITASDTRASAQFTRNVLAGEDIVMKSAGAQLRSYCYTLDCASAVLTVLLNGERGEAYNISNRDSVVTIREFAEAMAKYAGCRVVFENPTDAEQRGYNLMSNSSLDATKLEELGWRAKFCLEDGVKRTIDALR